MPRGLLVAVEGASAAGKSTAATTVGAQHGWETIGEAYDRITPRPSLAFRSPAELARLERRLLAAECRRYRAARRRSSEGRTVLLDTGFLGPLTYTAALVALGDAPAAVLPPLVAAARSAARKESWGLPDGVVYLDTPRRIRRARAEEDPARHPANLRTRHSKVGDWERRFYRVLLAPRLGSGFRSVSGAGSIARVVADLSDAVETIAATPELPRLPARAVLSLFGDAAAGRERARGNR